MAQEFDAVVRAPLAADLFSRLMRAAYFAAKREGLVPADAEDVASMSIEVYLEQAAQVEHPLSWVILVARRKAWAMKRQRAVREELTMRRYSDAPVATRPEVEMQLDMRAALAALGVEERTTILRRDLVGDSLDEIAAEVGLSLQTVKRRLKSGRSSLCRALDGRSVRCTSVFVERLL